jgi:hypothetical protein
MTIGGACHLQRILVLASAVILRSVSRGTRGYSLLSQIRDSLYLEGQVPVLISPRNRVARLYSPALGSLFVAGLQWKYSTPPSQGILMNFKFVVS